MGNDGLDQLVKFNRALQVLGVSLVAALRLLCVVPDASCLESGLFPFSGKVFVCSVADLLRCLDDETGIQ